MLDNFRKDIEIYKNPKKIGTISRFFKTGKGEYGYGDKFIGIMIPHCREIALKHKDLEFKDISKLLNSKIHEERQIAVLILVHNYKIGNTDIKNSIFKFYLQNSKKINNWDLVDLSAHKIVGANLIGRDKSILYRLANSKNIWERRISIISTLFFIKKNMYGETLAISKILLEDKEDLIQKAVGWMLREVGKREVEVLERFLKENYKSMPRTMLRYSIEKLSIERKKHYMKKI
jgi:3-methyladenine DNA glycosylase AlkD